MKINYFKEIDSLRAVAVLLVIANHFIPSAVQFGYLGVDVFFVISGFVITHQLQSIKYDSISRALLEFYVKRCARLLPLLLLVIILCFLSFSLFTPHPQSFFKTGMAGVFGFANLQLYFSSLNYFSSSADLNPFTHLWSLGVEEQFYLFFPVMFFYFKDNFSKRFLISIIITLSIISFLFFIVARIHNESFAFYIPVSRFWQILLGVLAYLYHSKIYNVFCFLLSDLPKNIISISLVFFIVFLIPFFPFVVAVSVVCLLVALLLVGAAHSCSINNILNNALLIHLGRISYGLYLIHWPVLVLLRWTFGVNTFTLIFAVLIIYLFSILSFYCFERKIRYRYSLDIAPRHLFKFLGMMLFVFCLPILQFKIFSVDVFLGARIDSNHLGVKSLLYPQIDSEDMTWTGDACTLMSNADVGKKFNVDDCIISSSNVAGKKKVIIIGNSFAASLFPMFIFKDPSVETSLIASWGASPAPNLPNDGPWSLSNKFFWNEVVLELVQTLNEGDMLFLASDLASLSPSRPSQSSINSLMTFERDLENISDTLLSRKIHFGLLGPAPFLREANCHPNMALEQYFAPNPNACTFYSLADTLRRLGAINDVLERLKSRKNFHVFNILDDLCFNEICSFIDGDGTILYRDEFSHFSFEISEKLQASYYSWVANLFGTQKLDLD